MRFLQPPKASSGGDDDGSDDDDDDECGGAKTYEYIYIHVPSQSGSGGESHHQQQQHLKRVCDMLVAYNQRHCVVDKNHNCSVMMDTLKKWADRSDSVVPVEYEFRKRSAKR